MSGHDHEKFMALYARFRVMEDKRRIVVCTALRISHGIYGRLMRTHRAETGEKTKHQLFRERADLIEKWVGDRDPSKINNPEAARALGLSPDKTRRALAAITFQRRMADGTKPAEAKPKRLSDKDNPRKLLYVEGGKLYSKNREPQEVGG